MDIKSKVLKIEIFNSIKLALRKGLAYIFVANILNKLIAFFSSIIIVRVIDKSLYGQWAYANNILSFFMLFAGMGVQTGVLQFSAETDNVEKRTSIFKTALFVGTIANVLLSILLYCTSELFMFPIPGVSTYIMFLALIPVASLLPDLVTVLLRAEYRNKEFSMYSSFLAGSSALLLVLGAMLFKVYGLIFAEYLYYLFASGIGIYLTWHEFSKVHSVLFLTGVKLKKFLSYSFILAIDNGISGILLILDTFLVGAIIQSDVMVASYKIATNIPFAMNFIPQSIILFVYPYFAKNRNNLKWVKYNYKKLIQIISIANIILTVFVFALAPEIIKYIFGEQYMDSLTTFRILIIGYFFIGTLRIPAGNIIGAIKKPKVNLYNSLFSGLSNIVLDVFFITKYGAVGAAIATVLIYIISGSLSNIYLFYYFRKNS